MTVEYKVQNLTLINVFEQIRALRECKDKEVILNFDSVNKVRYGGMIPFISNIEFMREKGYVFNHNITNGLTNGCSYASNMGFFHALGFTDIGKETNQPFKTNNFTSILNLTLAQLYNLGNNEYHEGIVKYSKQISDVLTKDVPRLKEVFEYLIREIIRNTFEHTTRKNVWIGAQRHPAEGIVEVVIADNGEGIKQTISVNTNLRPRISTDVEALKFAVKPGISGKSSFTKNRNENWINSGYGLFVTSEILNKMGSFYLISGSSCFKKQEDQPTLSANINYQGTCVVMEICLERAERCNSNIIEEMVQMGENYAKHDPLSIKHASGASRNQIR